MLKKTISLTLLIITITLHTSHPSTHDFLDYIVIGDYGDIWQPSEAKKTFNTLNTHASQTPFSFFATLGDNIYYQGITSPDDYLFQQMYSLFKDRQHLKDIDIYPVLGNHDCYGNPQAEVSVSSYHDNKWNMIDLQYSLAFDIDPQREGDELGMIMLNGCYLACLSSQPESQCSGIDVPSDEVIMEYYDRIDKKLTEFKEKNTLWISVYVHWPMFSDANDHHDTKVFQKELWPILNKHRVDFKFAGHTHTLQYMNLKYDTNLEELSKPIIKDDSKCKGDVEVNLAKDKKVVYKKGELFHEFVVGATGKHSLQLICMDYETRTKGNFVYGYNKHHSFARVHVTSEEFKVMYYNNKNEIVFEIKVQSDEDNEIIAEE